MSFHMSVDEDRCMGAQRCTYLAPAVLELTDDGVATVIDASALTLEQAEQLAGECPNLAINVEQVAGSAE